MVPIAAVVHVYTLLNWKSHERKTLFRVEFSTAKKGKAHSKYHLLKSYDYDIIYSPVFVAIYVANRRKFVLT